MQPTQPQYTITPDDTKRQETIAAAWRAYHGELVKPLERMPDQPDDNVMSNRCQPIVDRGVDFLFGKSLEISLDENAPAEAQKYLDDLWGRQEKRIPLLQKLAMSGAIAGNAYLRIMPRRSYYDTAYCGRSVNSICANRAARLRDRDALLY